MQQRAIYLQTATVSTVLEALYSHIAPLSPATETLATHQALGRVLAQPVFARYSSPAAHHAAMDGYAVCAAQTFGAREGKALALTLGTKAFAVNTGNVLPSGCDAVIMIEHAPEHDGTIHIEQACTPWQHVRRMGEEIVASELILPGKHTIQPWDIGTLLAGGIWQLEVYRTLRLHIIPTGDEVQDTKLCPEAVPGKVFDSNSPMLGALAEQHGAHPTLVPPVADTMEALTLALTDALESEADMVLFCAGSSAGSKDFTRRVIESQGHIIAHGLAVMPGKPGIAGVCRGKPVIGVPGYPVSALVCFEELVAPLIAHMQHSRKPENEVVEAELSRAISSRPGMEELVRVHIGRVGKRYVASPLPRGAANIRSVSRSQGLVRVPAPAEGLAQGHRVQAELSVPKANLDKVLLMTGSHDNSLDLLGDALMARKSPVVLASNHVGSMGGFIALRDGHCLCAGMHVFDPESDDFTFPFIPSLLPDTPVRVLNLAIRQQGLIVAKGNPLKLGRIADLAHCRFVNRQKGSGTRILFDWLLQKHDIQASHIPGYTKEEYTHMAVAVHVLHQEADAALGIYAAAKALDLDFVPLVRERYDLVIPEVFWEDPRILALREIVHSANFKSTLVALGGYETSLTGKLMRPGQGLEA